jgi:hypothetical protein
MEQAAIGAMFLLCRTSPVGNDCLANLQRKTRILEGIETFQSLVQAFSSSAAPEEAGRPSNQSSRARFIDTSVMPKNRSGPDGLKGFL